MPGDARLFVLATVSRLGEAHGHQVIREAAATALDRWAHVSQGALYSALRKCEADGLVAAVRTERSGRFPARTVYRVTADGHAALESGRAAAWSRTALPGDPFDLALTVSDSVGADRLRAVVEDRLAGWTAALAQLRHERATACNHLGPTELAVFDHVLMRHETEIAWHRQLLADVPSLVTQAGGPGAGARRQGQPPA